MHPSRPALAATVPEAVPADPATPAQSALGTRSHAPLLPPLAPRPNPYVPIHKALRALMSATVEQVGRADPTEGSEVTTALDAVDTLLEVLDGHAEREARFIHAALRERRPAAVPAFDADHASQAHAHAALRRDVQALRSAGTAALPQGLHGLYLALSALVGHHWQHMQEEETTMIAAVWAAFNDDEIQALEDRIVASVPPQEMAALLGWMLQALHAGERLALLSAMQAGMPPQAFDGVMDLAKSRLDAGAYAALARRLGRGDTVRAVARAA